MQDIQQRRRLYCTEIRADISRLENAQKRDKDVLENLPRLNLPKDTFDRKKIELNTNIENRYEELEILKTKERDVISGKLDEEMLSTAKQQREIYDAKRAVAKKKKQDIIDEDQDKKTKLYSRPKDENVEKYQKKDYAYFYRLYEKSDETLPDYMRENLKDMPNNKGYIWRGCWFLGDRPSERGQPMIMFEKVKGLLKIHEYDEHEYRLYEKHGKDKKKLVSKKARVSKKSRFPRY